MSTVPKKGEYPRCEPPDHKQRGKGNGHKQNGKGNDDDQGNKHKGKGNNDDQGNKGGKNKGDEQCDKDKNKGKGKGH